NLSRVEQLPNLTTVYEKSSYRGDLKNWPKASWSRLCPKCGSAIGKCRISPAGTWVACATHRLEGAVAYVTDHIQQQGVLLGIHEVTPTVAMGVAGKPLLRKHLEELRNSSLSDETIRAAGIYSEARPEVLGQLLGWNGKAGSLGPCIDFPFQDPNGKPTDY